MIRNYPIRFNKNKWNINFYSYHTCSEMCKYIVCEVEEHSQFFYIKKNHDYKNGECSQKNIFKKSEIRLSSFDRNNPKTSDGLLEKSEEIIIPDTTINVILEYPLIKQAKIVINSKDNRGFLLKDLIHQIKQIYKYIYKEEERTAHPITYHLSKFCKKCSGPDFKKESYKFIDTKDLIDDCSICHDNFNSDTCGVLNCGHIFHQTCIEEWLNYSINCPLCRINCSSECIDCKGTHIVYYDYHGTVIPIEERGLTMFRNTTDGLFGIYLYDFDDLYLKQLRYNYQTKELFMDFKIC
jgi:hypothetical protein